MTEQQTDLLETAKRAYLSRIDAHIDSMNGQSDHPANTLRRKARTAVENGTFPGRKNEDWKYTSVKPILSRPYQQPSGDIQPEVSRLDGLDSYLQVFVNGKHRDDLSDQLPEEVFFGPVADAWEDPQHARAAQDMVEMIKSSDLNVFEGIALGTSDNVTLLSIPDQFRLDKPVECAYVTAAEEGVAINPFLLVKAGKASEAEIIARYTGDQSESYINPAQRFYIGAGANISMYRMQDEGAESHHVTHTHAIQERDSTFGTYAAEIGGKIVRNNIHAVHTGTNITTNLYGVVLSGHGQHMDTQSFIDHATPHCQSNELYKGILSGNGRGVFNGKIIVRQDAQKTNAFQQNSTLIMSPLAVMDSKPQLEIFADDVKCSHGATIGQLDEDAMFYLRSRGLNKSRASALLQQAFAGEVIDAFPNKAIASAFRTIVNNKLHIQQHNQDNA